MKRIFVNIGLMLLVTLLSLAVAEAGLRLLTPFPVHGKKANKIYDADLGYRLNLNHPSIDANGFRNKGDKPHIVAAIGDSHTYGSGVEAEDSWPSQFEKITGQPTYNFGVGSYAVYTYYALARRALEQGYKNIIIALYIHNDFTPHGTSCAIDYDASELWRDAKKRLSLNLPPCQLEYTWKTADAPRFIRFFRGKVQFAIPSAIKVLIVKPLSEWRYQKKQEGAKNAPGKTVQRPAASPTSRKPASRYFSSRGLKVQKEELLTSDLDNPETQRIVQDFEKLLVDLKRMADGNDARIGLLFLPSKVQVTYKHSPDKDTFEKVPWMRKMAENHIAMQKRLSEHLSRNGIPWATAMPELAAALEKAELAGKRMYRSGGNHPNVMGYRAYGEAAVKLFRKMPAQ